MGELSIEHGREMTPVREGATEFLRAGLADDLGQEMSWDIVANLPQDGKVTLGQNRAPTSPRPLSLSLGRARLFRCLGSDPRGNLASASG